MKIFKIQHDTSRRVFLFKALVTGMIVGIVVSLFRFLIEYIFEWVLHVYQVMQAQPHLIVYWVIFTLIIGFLLAYLVKKDPMIKGSGIPQIEGQLNHGLDISWLSVLIRKGIGGILAISSGLFLGREGPSIQLGAAIGQGVDSIFKGDSLSKKILISNGAGAGLAAAFNAPVAGLMFVLEEVHHNFSPIVLVTTLVATTTANFVSLYIFGQTPILNFGFLPTIPLSAYGSLLGLGVLLGITGVGYQKVVIWIPTMYQKLKRIPSYAYGLIPLLLVIPIGLWNPTILGGGSQIISQLMDTTPTFKMILLFFAIRFIFSMISYGSGLPGGIFLPILSLGSLWGALWGLVMIHFGFIDPIFFQHFLILGMAGYFTAIGKAPMTAIILISEMTGSLSYLMPLAFVSVVAYVVADLCGGEPVYEVMLARMLPQQEVDAENTLYFSHSVSVDDVVVGRMISDINWPEHTLLISIDRGDKQIIPKGDTIIRNGDILKIATTPASRRIIEQKINAKY